MSELATTIVAASESIYERWSATWDALDPSVPWVGDNESAPAPVDGSAWARLSVIETSTGQDTIGEVGDRFYLRRGVVKVQLFTPADAGTAPSNALVQIVRGLFEGVSFAGVDFDDAAAVSGGRADGRWWLVVVASPFRYRELK